jgi:uncharacterized protein DUF4154
MNLRFSFGVVLAFLVAFGAQCELPDEYQVKAAFLYNFAKFVEWPPAAFDTSHDPVIICLLGQSPFSAALETAIHGKIVAERTFVVREVAGAEPASNCHILFVSSSERKRLRSIRELVKGSGTLTVGESTGFAAEGGVINFKLENGRVRLEINPDAADREKLHISSKLLSLAQIVRK